LKAVRNKKIEGKIRRKINYNKMKCYEDLKKEKN
jgi:hypothetical protein